MTIQCFVSDEIVTIVRPNGLNPIAFAMTKEEFFKCSLTVKGSGHRCSCHSEENAISPFGVASMEDVEKANAVTEKPNIDSGEFEKLPDFYADTCLSMRFTADKGIEKANDEKPSKAILLKKRTVRVKKPARIVENSWSQKVMDIMKDGVPRKSGELAEIMGVKSVTIGSYLLDLCKRQFLMRTGTERKYIYTLYGHMPDIALVDAKQGAVKIAPVDEEPKAVTAEPTVVEKEYEEVAKDTIDCLVKDKWLLDLVGDARKVYKYLKENGESYVKRIASYTRMTDNSVHNALNQLKDKGLIVSRPWLDKRFLYKVSK